MWINVKRKESCIKIRENSIPIWPTPIPSNRRKRIIIGCEKNRKDIARARSYSYPAKGEGKREEGGWQKVTEGRKEGRNEGWTWERRDHWWDDESTALRVLSLSFLRHPRCPPPNGRGCKPILSGKRIGNRRHQPVGNEDNNKRAQVYNRA